MLCTSRYVPVNGRGKSPILGANNAMVLSDTLTLTLEVEVVVQGGESAT